MGVQRARDVEARRREARTVLDKSVSAETHERGMVQGWMREVSARGPWLANHNKNQQTRFQVLQAGSPSLAVRRSCGGRRSSFGHGRRSAGVRATDREGTRIGRCCMFWCCAWLCALCPVLCFGANWATTGAPYCCCVCTVECAQWSLKFNIAHNS